MILRNMFEKQDYLPDKRRVPWEGIEFDYLRLTMQRQLGNRFIAHWGNTKLKRSIEITDKFRVEYGYIINQFSQKSSYHEVGVLFDLLSNPITRFIISNESDPTYNGCCDIGIDFRSGHRLILDESKYEGFEEFWTIDHGDIHESEDPGGYHFWGGFRYEDCSTTIKLPAHLYVDEITISTMYGIDLHVSGNYADSRRQPFFRFEYPFTVEVDNEIHDCRSYSDVRHLTKYLPTASDNYQCQFLVDERQRLRVVQWNGNQLVSQQLSVNANAWNMFERFTTSIDFPEDFNPDKYSIPTPSDVNEDMLL